MEENLKGSAYPGRRMYGAADFENLKEGSKAAIERAQLVTSQVAGVCLVLSLAYESVFNDAKKLNYLDQVADASAMLLGRCWDDLNVAASMM